MEKRTLIKWISALVLVIIFGVGYYFGMNRGSIPAKDNNLDSLIQKENLVIDSLKQVIQGKTITIDSLKLSLEQTRKEKKERIEKVKNLGAKESIAYLEEKIREVDNIDSLKFFSSSDSDSCVIICKEEIQAINGIIEEKEILEEEVIKSDSIILAQEEKIESLDTLVQTIQIREEKELQYYEEKTDSLQKQVVKEKRKANFWKAGTGIGAVGMILLLILL